MYVELQTVKCFCATVVNKATREPHEDVGPAQQEAKISLCQKQRKHIQAGFYKKMIFCIGLKQVHRKIKDGNIILSCE